MDPEQVPNRRECQLSKAHYHKAALGGAVPAIALVCVAGCSSSSNTTPIASSTPSPSSTVNTVTFDKAIQSQLQTVGCYTGPVDGVIGPQTDAAIVAFQKGANLPVTGELSAQTDAALKNDVNAKATICTSAASPTVTAASPTVTAAGATCTASSISVLIPSGANISEYTCAQGFVGGIYAYPSPKNKAPDVGNFFGEIEGNQWVALQSSQFCKDASMIPPSLSKYCSGLGP